MVTHRDRLVALVSERPGLTERELAKLLRGKAGEQQNVNPICRSLSEAGIIERRGLGGAASPFRYYPLRGRTRSELSQVKSAAQPVLNGGPHPAKQHSTNVTADWYWEGKVVESIVRHLENNGWKIESAADTASKQRGVDIHATKGKHSLLVEAKGYPSKMYRDPRRVAELKPTSQTSQAQHWYSHALLKVMRLQAKHPDASVAMAFPNFPRYRTLFGETKAGLEKLGIGLITVTAEGDVETWGLPITQK